VTYSDPLGLCPENNPECDQLVRDLREHRGSAFQRAADAYEKTTYRVNIQPGDSPWINEDNENTDGNPDSFFAGTVRDDFRVVILNGDFSRADQLIFAVHEAEHLVGGDDRAAWRATAAAYLQMGAKERRDAPHGAVVAWAFTRGRIGAPHVDFFEWRTWANSCPRWRSCLTNQ